MLDNNRPKLKLEKNQTQRFLEYATFGLIVLVTIYTSINYNSLPEQIPMHFNSSGKVDSYGSRNLVWILLVLSAGLCFGLFKLNKYPHLFNYPNLITKDNAKKNYTTAVKIMSLVNFLMALLFAVIIYQVVSLGILKEDKISKWSEYLIYIVVAVMTFAPLVWIVKNALSSNKK